ncbi:MAG: flippase [Ignavibacteriales bacterium]|nr:flippase [Ignavibacteriales bacterium]
MNFIIKKETGLKLLEQFMGNKEVRSSFIYLFSSIAGTGVAFFLVPILTRYLTPHDYGIVSNYTAIFTIASYFVSLSCIGYVFRNHFFLNNDENKKSISNTFFVNIAMTLVTFFLLLIFSGIIKKELEIPIGWLLIIPFISICQVIIDITLSFYQAKKRAKEYSMFQILQTIMNLGLSVILVALFLWNWEGRIMALLISSFIVAAIGIILLVKNRLINFSLKLVDKKNIKDFLNFGIPLIPHSIGGFVLVLSDRFFLSSMVSVSAAGLYSVGFTFGGLLMILHGAFHKVFMPYAFENLSKTKDSDEVKSKLVKITYMYITFFIICSVGLYFVAKTIFPFFVGEKFQDAYVYVLWIALGYAMLAAYQMFGIYVIYTKKTKMVAFRTDFLAALIKLPLTYFLIKTVGPIGAAQATFVAYLITAISAWHINNKAYPMPWFSFAGRKEKLIEAVK